jgi:hypothetical protein
MEAPSSALSRDPCGPPSSTGLRPALAHAGDPLREPIERGAVCESTDARSMHGHECCHAAPNCQCPRGSQAIQVDIYARHVGDASLLAHQAIVTMTVLRPYRNGRQRLRPIQGMQALPCRFWPGWQAGPSVRQAPSPPSWLICARHPRDPRAGTRAPSRRSALGARGPCATASDVV